MVGKAGNLGLRVAHTPGEMVENEGGEAADLFEDAPLFAGPVRHVADTLDRAKGRGRPKGAANKRTTQMRDIILGMGFRHPALNLAALSNADPVALGRELGCDPDVAMGFIVKANVELMPYMESKRPTEVHVEERSLGVLVVGDMTTKAVADGVFSLTGIVGESDTEQ